jgi:ketosteroid isomerase-like protein
MISKSCIGTVMAVLIASSPFTFAIEAANQSADRAAIEAFTRKFLHAFEDLDMKQFIACFADDATVFFPTPERVHGKLAIKQRFERVSGVAQGLVHRFTTSTLRIFRFN